MQALLGCPASRCRPAGGPRSGEAGGARRPTQLLRIALPSPLTRTATVCRAAERYVLDKLKSADATYREMQMRMADPDVANNNDEFQKVAKAAADLEPSVNMYRSYMDTEKQLQARAADICRHRHSSAITYISFSFPAFHAPAAAYRLLEHTSFGLCPLMNKKRMLRRMRSVF